MLVSVNILLAELHHNYGEYILLYGLLGSTSEEVYL